MQRERLLAKEAKYENGLQRRDVVESEELLNLIKDTSSTKTHGK